ncbi:UNKNOWN [Stylonychia lemnae]|uniref:Uncharacterized protein n=1 Tax=Stylonychia lemnae TaxID=5949 RepID=A0A078A2Z8_STYLE|nr:UNKNOWN [Stylonychia lemnae]|eukprot:CDW75863.1 UNKNOWN [Stylonychia lemnae]
MTYLNTNTTSKLYTFTHAVEFDLILTTTHVVGAKYLIGIRVNLERLVMLLIDHYVNSKSLYELKDEPTVSVLYANQVGAQFYMHFALPEPNLIYLASAELMNDLFKNILFVSCPKGSLVKVSNLTTQQSIQTSDAKRLMTHQLAAVCWDTEFTIKLDNFIFYTLLMSKSTTLKSKIVFNFYNVKTTLDKIFARLIEDFELDYTNNEPILDFYYDKVLRIVYLIQLNADETQAVFVVIIKAVEVHTVILNTKKPKLAKFIYDPKLKKRYIFTREAIIDYDISTLDNISQIKEVKIIPVFNFKPSQLDIAVDIMEGKFSYQDEITLSYHSDILEINGKKLNQQTYIEEEEKKSYETPKKQPLFTPYTPSQNNLMMQIQNISQQQLFQQEQKKVQSQGVFTFAFQPFIQKQQIPQTQIQQVTSVQNQTIQKQDQPMNKYETKYDFTNLFSNQSPEFIENIFKPLFPFAVSAQQNQIKEVEMQNEDQDQEDLNNIIQLAETNPDNLKVQIEENKKADENMNDLESLIVEENKGAEENKKEEEKKQEGENNKQEENKKEGVDKKEEEKKKEGENNQEEEKKKEGDNKNVEEIKDTEEKKKEETQNEVSKSQVQSSLNEKSVGTSDQNQNIEEQKTQENNLSEEELKLQEEALKLEQARKEEEDLKLEQARKEEEARREEYERLEREFQEQFFAAFSTEEGICRLLLIVRDESRLIENEFLKLTIKFEFLEESLPYQILQEDPLHCEIVINRASEESGFMYRYTMASNLIAALEQANVLQNQQDLFEIDLTIDELQNQVVQIFLVLCFLIQRGKEFYRIHIDNSVYEKIKWKIPTLRKILNNSYPKFSEMSDYEKSIGETLLHTFLPLFLQESFQQQLQPYVDNFLSTFRDANYYSIDRNSIQIFLECNHGHLALGYLSWALKFDEDFRFLRYQAIKLLDQYHNLKEALVYPIYFKKLKGLIQRPSNSDVFTSQVRKPFVKWVKYKQYMYDLINSKGFPPKIKILDSDRQQIKNIQDKEQLIQNYIDNPPQRSKFVVYRAPNFDSAYAELDVLKKEKKRIINKYMGVKQVRIMENLEFINKCLKDYEQLQSKILNKKAKDIDKKLNYKLAKKDDLREIYKYTHKSFRIYVPNSAMYLQCRQKQLEVKNCMLWIKYNERNEQLKLEKYGMQDQNSQQSNYENSQFWETDI